MRSIEKSFYSTKVWKTCRDAYLMSVNGRCERCLAKGLHVPARVVHHKVHLNLDNKEDAAVAYNFENLEALCQDCHNAEHFSKQKRWKVNERGEVISTEL